MTIRSYTSKVVAVGIAFLSAGSFAADDAANFPTKSISLVVPYAAGGSSDTADLMLLGRSFSRLPLLTGGSGLAMGLPQNYNLRGSRSGSFLAGPRMSWH